MFTLAATHIVLRDNNMFELKLSETLQTPLVRALRAVLLSCFYGVGPRFVLLGDHWSECSGGPVPCRGCVCSARQKRWTE